MKIFIKENSVVTEWSYAPILRTILLEEGFTEITVPDMDDANPYKFEDFEKVNGELRLK